MAIPEFCKWHSKSPGDGGQIRKSGLSRRIVIASSLACLLRGEGAEISSFDLSLLDESVVPNELFFVRNHFAVPNASQAGWKLEVAGAVASPLQLSYEELIGFSSTSLPVTLECAENPVDGGLVSHAEWTGVSLASLLAKAAPSKEAEWVRLSGADGFSRTIPLSKAMDAATLIAYRMNGEKLPLSHGLPVRAIISGWYAMDSVKWLRRIEVLKDGGVPSGYLRLTRSLLTGVRPTGAVTAGNVKSAFCRPLDRATLVGRRFLVRGVAWAGENKVRRVEVSVDGAKTWMPARFDSDPLRYAWVPWTCEWKIPGPGQYDLSVRAEDDKGRAQPERRASDRADSFELNAWQTVRVSVV